MSITYASDNYITKLHELEESSKSTISTTLPVGNMDSFNQVWYPDDAQRLNNPSLDDISTFAKQYPSKYKFFAYEAQAKVGNNGGTSTNIGCKTPAEYSTTAPVQMTRMDDGYTHTFQSCRTKAILNDKPYFALTKPSNLPQNTDEYNCYVATNIDSSITNYYNYITVWSLGPDIKSFGLSEGGDILIDAANIQTLRTSLGVPNVSYSKKDEIYTLGNNNTFVSNSPTSLNVYAFDITQASVRDANIFDNHDNPGSIIPNSRVSRLQNTNNKFIVGAVEEPSKTIKMVGVELSIQRATLYARIFAAKRIPVKYLVSSITIFSTNEWLQISAVKVIDENGNDISTTGMATSTGTMADGRVLPGNVNNGKHMMKPYYDGYHSNTNINARWTLTFPKPVNIKQVVYYNRLDCCRDRARNYRLAAHDENGNILYESTTFSTADVQNFDINIKIKTIDNEIDSLSKLWNDGAAEDVPITSNSNIPGYGLQNLNILVSKEGYKESESNFSKTQNVGSNINGTLYKTITAITEEQCKASCVDNLDCKSYSVINPRTIYKEAPPTEIGYFLDDDRPGRPRAMEQWYVNQAPGNTNRFNRQECLNKTAEKHPNNKYFALQYMGNCFSSNKSPEDGYAKYGAMANCGELGGDWCNHVFQRNQTPANVVDCNLYRANQPPVNIPGAILGNRDRVSEPVNPTKLNLTNNILKFDMPLCKDTTCKIRIELGNDGNIKLYKTSSDATSSSVNGVVLWELFTFDSSSKENIDKLKTIANIEWQTASRLPTSNNILSPGEEISSPSSIPNISQSSRTSMISTNGKFKLEIVNGTLQLKATVYGCFSSDSTYTDTTKPIFTTETQGKPNSYYIYNANLKFPKLDQPYYALTGYNNNVGIRPIEKNNTILKNTNEYLYSQGFKPTNADVNMSAGFPSDVNGCISACNEKPDCKYAYIGNSTQNTKVCYLGSKSEPAYIGDPIIGNNSYANGGYTLLKRKQQLDIHPNDVPPGSSSDIRYEGLRNMNTIEGMQSETPPFVKLGPPISSIDSVGEYATPAGRNLKTVFTNVRTNNERVKDPNYKKPPPPPDTSSDGYPPLTTYSNSSIGTNIQQTVGSLLSDKINTSTSNIISQAKSIVSPAMEGFDTHAYTKSNPNCGKNGETPCQSSILYGQIYPLQKIASDYSNLTYKLNKQQRDLSSNLTNYKTVYDDINGDKKYDFNTSYPVEPSSNVDLHTVRHNDSTQIALQSNNMYIAGSMLTTAILISAIYLGRS